MRGRFSAVCRYEFRMQIRKRSLWLSTAGLAVLIAFVQGDQGPRYLPADADAARVMGSWALLFSMLLPIGFGMVLADRLVRDHRLGAASLLASLPTRPGALVAGKYAGSVAATAVPALLVLLVTAAGEFVHRGDPALFPSAVAAFAVVLLPGLAFVAAFALVCPLVLSAPLFRVLFAGYWFWGNLLGPNYLPSLTGTLLTPIGDYPASWLIGERALYAGAPGWLSFLRPEPGGGAALLSIVLLAVLATPPLVFASPLLARRTSS
ncbi:ABC transporter permease [Microtetraspora malaysiensis]|uniref:ABC transporter permease n=1 Tax=Microtetraspora malaysiensis TaxID=161358 RepID=UPI003D94924A